MQSGLKVVVFAFVGLVGAIQQPAPAVALGDPERVGTGCNISMSRKVALPTLVDVPDTYTANAPEPVTTAMKGWAEYMMRLASRAAVSSSARNQFKDELLAVAQKDAMQFPKGWEKGNHRPPSTIYHTMETLFPAMVGYARYKSSFSESEQELVQSWAKRIIDRLGRTKQMQNWKYDNKKYQYGALMAVYGYSAEDGSYLKKAERIYTTAIKGMREDGSLKGDSGRGGSALHYTSLALANLTAIAEFAALSGRNLYDYQSRGKSLHLGIQFLVKATSNPELIAGYANTEGWQEGSFAGYTPTNQDRRWASGPAAMWGYTYFARYGSTASGQNLRKISPFLASGRGGVHQQSGGNSLCFVGK
jgi:hypothetical protein